MREGLVAVLQCPRVLTLTHTHIRRAGSGAVPGFVSRDIYPSSFKVLGMSGHAVKGVKVWGFGVWGFGF